MTLLQEIDRQRVENRERRRQEVRQRLREVVNRTVPGAALAQLAAAKLK